METPNITKAQIVAIIAAVASFLAVLGLDVSIELQSSLVVMLTALGTIVPASLAIADAIIRKGRAENADKIAASRNE